MDRSTSWLRWALFESNPQSSLRQTERAAVASVLVSHDRILSASTCLSNGPSRTAIFETQIESTVNTGTATSPKCMRYRAIASVPPIK